jgi:hypothetical protein
VGKTHAEVAEEEGASILKQLASKWKIAGKAVRAFSVHGK